MTGFYRAAVARPRRTLVVAVLATAGLAAGIPRLQVETDLRAAMPHDHPVCVYNDWVESHFGIDDRILVLVVNDGPSGVFTPETLHLVEYVSDAMAFLDEIDGDDLVSLSKTDNITASGDALRVAPFFYSPPTTLAEARALRDAVFENPMMIGSVVSSDGSATIIAGEVKEGSDRLVVHDAVERILERAPVTEEHVWLAGQPVIESELDRLMRLDVAVLLPLVATTCGALLYVLLGSLRGVVLPLLVVVASVLCSVGAMGWTGALFYPLSALTPVLLVPIGIADAVHIIHRFLRIAHAQPKASRAELVLATLERLGRPVIFTSLTTAAGMFALAAAPMLPLQVFGVFTALGVLTAMVFSLTLLPACLCLLPVPHRAVRRMARAQTGGPVVAVLGRILRIVTHRPAVAMTALPVFLVVALLGIPQIVVDGSMVQNLPHYNAVRVADDELVRRFGGSAEMHVVLDGAHPDAWTEPTNLRALADLQRYIEAHAHVADSSRSLVDYVTRMNAVMEPDQREAYRIPDSRELIAQYLLLYTLSGEPGDLDDVVDYEYRFANLRAQIDSDRSPVARDVIESVTEYAQEHLVPAGIEVAVSGNARTLSTFLDLLISGQLLSLAIAAPMVAAFMAFMCRSLTGGLLCAVPITLATLFNFGLLGLLGIPLDPVLALMSTLALGIGADYAIHFYLAYQLARAETATREAAMRETLYGSGVAILFNAIIIIAGFMVLAISGFPPNRALGTLVSVNMLVCFVATVTALAATLHQMQPTLVGPVRTEP